MNKKKPHGAWVKRLISEGHVRGKNYIQVGLRGYYPDEQSFDRMRKRGLTEKHYLSPKTVDDGRE